MNKAIEDNISTKGFNPLETQAKDIYSKIDQTVPKEIDKIKGQQDAFATKTHDAIDNINQHPYTPTLSTATVPHLKTLRQSLGSFGGIITSLISVLALKDGGSSALNFANMYNGMAESLRRNNLQEFMAKSQEFKDHIIQLKNNNEDKLQQYQEYMSSILTGNKLEEQKLQAELQPEQLTIQSLFSEAKLFNVALNRTIDIQKLAVETEREKEDFQVNQEKVRVAQKKIASRAIVDYTKMGNKKLSQLTYALVNLKKLPQTPAIIAAEKALQQSIVVATAGTNTTNTVAPASTKAKPRNSKAWWGGM